MNAVSRVGRNIAPLTTASVVAVAATVIALAINPATLPVLIVGVAIFTPLERLRPRRAVMPSGDTLVVLAHATATTTMTAGLLTLAVAVTTALPVWQPSARWFASAAPPAALMVIVVVGDIGYYWMHRAMHRLPLLWRFHRIHHGSTELYWLAAARAHPVDQVLLHAGWLVPLHLLGARSAWFVTYATLLTMQTLLVHSNVAISGGWLRRVVVTPDFHHWHHSAERDAWNHNFASQLAFLDTIFGTTWLPTGRIVTTYGVGEALEPSYAGQLVEPIASSVHLLRGARGGRHRGLRRTRARRENSATA